MRVLFELMRRPLTTAQAHTHTQHTHSYVQWDEWGKQVNLIDGCIELAIPKCSPRSKLKAMTNVFFALYFFSFLFAALWRRLYDYSSFHLMLHTIFLWFFISLFFFPPFLLLLLAAFALWPKTVATHQFSFRPQLWLSPIIHASAAVQHVTSVQFPLSLSLSFYLFLSLARSLCGRAG